MSVAGGVAALRASVGLLRGEPPSRELAAALAALIVAAWVARTELRDRP